MLSPIFNSFYDDRTASGQNDVCVNLYAEIIGQKIVLLHSVPGKKLLATVGTGPIRGMYAANNGLLYVVSANQFFSVDSNWNVTLIGSVTNALGSLASVYMVDSPTQILVVDGFGGWVWDFVASTYTQVIPNVQTSCTLPNIVVYQDGFALVNSGGTNQIYQSNNNDLSLFATPTGLGGYTANNAYVQGNSQPVVTMAELKEEIWIFKQKSIEIWVNAGNPGFAFEPLLGVSIPIGCCAANSVARLGESLVWLGSDDQGDGVVYMSAGYNAKPITTFALAKMFQSFQIISDAIGFSYQESGHFFYVITFPTQNISFSYDLTSGKWHQRASFSNGSFNRESGNCCEFFNGWNITGDYDTGGLYALDVETHTDEYGNPIKWMRSWNAIPLGEEPVPLSFDNLQILLETGITVPSGLNPQIMLEFSDDGGYNWIGSVQVPMGKIGETSWRAIQNRLGSTKIGTGLERVWRISGVDPIEVKITGAKWEGGPS